MYRCFSIHYHLLSLVLGLVRNHSNSYLFAVILAAICIEADSTPFTAGANDNATAAGMVLTLAEQFRKKPLEHTRVWAVCTGCEEVQHYGMIDFYRRHLA